MEAMEPNKQIHQTIKSQKGGKMTNMGPHIKNSELLLSEKLPGVSVSQRMH